jgi:hypothetical protein
MGALPAEGTPGGDIGATPNGGVGVETAAGAGIATAPPAGDAGTDTTSGGKGE